MRERVAIVWFSVDSFVERFEMAAPDELCVLCVSVYVRMYSS